MPCGSTAPLSATSACSSSRDANADLQVVRHGQVRGRRMHLERDVGGQRRGPGGRGRYQEVNDYALGRAQANTEGVGIRRMVRAADLVRGETDRESDSIEVVQPQGRDDGLPRESRVVEREGQGEGAVQ